LALARRSELHLTARRLIAISDNAARGHGRLVRQNALPTARNHVHPGSVPTQDRGRHTPPRGSFYAHYGTCARKHAGGVLHRSRIGGHEAFDAIRQSRRRPLSRLTRLRGHDVLPQCSSKTSPPAASAPAAQVAYLHPRQQAAMRSAAKTALLSGEISTGAGLLGGIGQGLSGLGGGAPSSMPKGYNPNPLGGLY
jgi:hypothetical protein